MKDRLIDSCFILVGILIVVIQRLVDRVIPPVGQDGLFDRWLKRREAKNEKTLERNEEMGERKQ